MKRTIIGGLLSLIGSILSFAIITTAGNNLVSGWDSELGRFWTTVIEYRLMFLLVLSLVFTVLGIILLVVELFRKD